MAAVSAEPLSGLYTVDNMDFVLRDAYMSGYSTRAFDLARLLHYSQYHDRGLTIHERGLSAWCVSSRCAPNYSAPSNFTRTVRAIDLELQEVFRDSKPYLFPGDPRQTSRRVPAADRVVAADAGFALGRQGL